MSDKNINEEQQDSIIKYFTYQQIIMQFANVCSSLTSALINSIDIDNDSKSFDENANLIVQLLAAAKIGAQNVEDLYGIGEKVKKEYDKLQEERN